MLSFIRSKTVGVQPQDDDSWMVHGRLDDALYTVDLEVRVSRPDLVIAEAIGSLGRYTTVRCRLGEEYAGRVVGEPLGAGLDRRLKDEVGKHGCRHLANLFIDCAQAAARAELADFYRRAKAENPALEPPEALRLFLDAHPGLEDYLQAN